MTPRQGAAVGGIVLASAGLIGALSQFEGTRYTPYRDVGGVLTVCEGVTGKAVIPGRLYSRDECDALTSGALEKHGREVLACTTGAEWTQARYDAIALLAYNVGTARVCGTCLKDKQPHECLGDLIRANKWPQACGRINDYAKVRIDGELRPCSDRRWDCYGVYTRRKAESDWCSGAKPAPTLGATG